MSAFFADKYMAKSKTYFGGANGEKGFVCYFGGITASVGRIYILKGGCGCGKSALMKKVAAEGDRCGEAVERIYCASDPSSLDGVLLPERSVAVMDGTAPHEISPRLPGAADTIVDLGEYWDSSVLRGRSAEIRALSDKKNVCRMRAYSLLSAVGSLKEERNRLLSTAVLWEKMSCAAKRIIGRLAPQGAEFSAALRPRSAFCADGIVHAENYGEDSRIAIKDPHGIAYLFYEQLLTAAFDRKLSVTVSPDPLSPERISALMVDDCGVLFCEDGEGKPVNMDRFLAPDRLTAVRGKLRFINKAVKNLTDAAILALAESRALHSALESIYTPAMDFNKVNARTEQIMEEIFA